VYLEINGIFFAYPAERPGLAPRRNHEAAPWVLSAYSLAMEAGERLGIAGPSGQGKSTLLRIIAGLERPQKGSVAIDGRLVSGPGVHINPEDRRVSMVFQDYGLFPHMTVAENVAYGLFRLNRGERRRQVEAMLELTRMGDFARRYPYELSGGQQQRAALARALAPRPKLLLLDEPLSSLDAELKAEIRAEMRGLMEQTQATCLFVSHDIEDLKAVCGRVELIHAKT
jgi:iron(III) transport system ATP-binding protein